MSDRTYNTIFVTQPAHDYSALAKYCKQVKFVQTGKEDSLEKVLDICIQSLKSFNPSTDAIVVVGKVNGAFLAGVAFSKLFQKGTTFDMGVYIDVGTDNLPAKDYRWEKVTI